MAKSLSAFQWIRNAYFRAALIPLLLAEVFLLLAYIFTNHNTLQENTKTINALAESLKDDFSGTVYARFAALQLAALAVEAGDLDVAESELRWALTKEGENSELGQLIQLRLARVLADQGDTTAALAILDSNKGAYPAAYATAKGDILVAEGRHAEALSAYREARAVLLALGNPPGILDTKITSLESRLAPAEEAS